METSEKTASELTILLPDHLREALRSQAKSCNRSLNFHVTSLLEECTRGKNPASNFERAEAHSAQMQNAIIVCQAQTLFSDLLIFALEQEKARAEGNKSSVAPDIETIGKIAAILKDQQNKLTTEFSTKGSH